MTGNHRKITDCQPSYIRVERYNGGYMKFKLELAVKPYAACLSCHHRNVRCNGTRTAPMDLLTWCAYMRDLKEANKLTNADIAEKSEVSIKTIERIMALNCEQDIMRDTARRIENAIVGIAGQHSCYLTLAENPYDETAKLIEKLQAEIDYLRVENERKGRIIDKLLDK